ncbi:hypothetical protein L2755_12045 [Shewanella abyssi]|uniref:hypothetical protein n=1 Tax=Shewanella abyssi TaxID=311789 RepID=UPI00200E5555|nr:hypothetical protein [Shewanella abyssi]MCL1050354.1 hypothetical protein [Shewanella abyssi]
MAATLAWFGVGLLPCLWPKLVDHFKSGFVSTIYDAIQVGDIIHKPRVTSVILDIYENGNIYFRVGESNKKFVSTRELVDVYAVLSASELCIKEICNIASAPCNSTTIQWLLTHAELAKRSQHGSLSKSWE